MATKQKKAIDRAIRENKRLFEGCVFCDSPYMDGMHIVPRDYKKSIGLGQKLIAEPFNLPPGCNMHHRVFDNRDGMDRPLWSKIRMLLRLSLPHHKPKVYAQVVLLKRAIREITNGVRRRNQTLRV